MECDRAERLVDEYFIDRGEFVLERVKPHLADCPDCQHRFDALFEAESGLANPIEADVEGAPILTVAEKEMLFERVMESLEPPVADTSAGWAWLFAPLAALLMLLLVLPEPPSQRVNVPGDEFRPRGAESGEPSPVGMRVLCMREQDGKVKPEPLKPFRPGAAAPSCPKDAALGLTVFNYTTERMYFWLYEVNLVGRSVLEFPRDRAKRHMIAPTKGEVPLAHEIFLDEVFDSTFRLCGVFSKHPYDVGQLTEQLELFKWQPPSDDVRVQCQTVYVTKNPRVP